MLVNEMNKRMILPKWRRLEDCCWVWAAAAAAALNWLLWLLVGEEWWWRAPAEEYPAAAAAATVFTDTSFGWLLAEPAAALLAELKEDPVAPAPAADPTPPDGDPPKRPCKITH